MTEVANSANPFNLKLFLGEDGYIYSDEDCTEFSGLKVDGLSINGYDREYREYTFMQLLLSNFS
jgi:hypothetical protein